MDIGRFAEIHKNSTVYVEHGRVVLFPNDSFNVLQCVAVSQRSHVQHYIQCVAVCCNELQCVAMSFSESWISRTALHSIIQCVAVCYNVLQ